ncbi:MULTISPECIES: hypothetical protein [unclassified Streptomyces]|uniref:hypothetical protein n=1 Tax=unclassified Streptomyces TaxID=2593676 RepID=UPI002238560A|nr:hypothetical protein [Streptomyces sp. SHP 1-2]MCW5249902.1 hypothetical protein [Streptomyces sp. SHP 1-2]
MAHAAPKPATAVRNRPRPLPDVFSARAHLMARWTVIVSAGLVYGYWAAAIRRFGGPITGRNLLFGFMTALAFVILCAVIGAVASRLPREGHAVLWGAFAGSALGFLYAQSGVGMITCVVVSLIVGGAVFLGLFYRYYTHEDARGHHVP